MGMADLSSALMGADVAKQQASLQNAQASLQLATQERDRQDLLRKTLARQTVRNAAGGIDAASGSALSLANAAKAQTDRELSLLYADADLSEQRRRLVGGGGTSGLRSLLNLGMSAWK